MPVASDSNVSLYPVFFFSHGSTRMLGEPSAPAAYWEHVGRLAIAQGVERIVMMGAHWHIDGDYFGVATNPKPDKEPVAWCNPKLYLDFDPNIDVAFSERVIKDLQNAGIATKACPDFTIIHDTFLILKWMFPKGKSLPLTIVSTNRHCDPHDHLRVGQALRHLRREKTLIIGSGGAVHNLYRNSFAQVVFHKDNLAMEKRPEQWALDFGQTFSDAVSLNSGPKLARAITRLLQHPQYRDAHGTDEHFAPSIFAAGAASDPEDEQYSNHVGAECWELLNMRNTQYQFGSWPFAPHVTQVPERVKAGLPSPMP